MKLKSVLILTLSLLIMPGCTTGPSCPAAVDVDQSLLLPRKALQAMPEKEIARKEFMEIIIWNNAVLLQDRADLETLQNVVRRQISQ